MSNESPSRHYYHAEASVLFGKLNLPVSQEIKPQAFAKLSEEGGYLSERSENYRLEAVISYRSAYAQVAGNRDRKPGHGYSTLATAVIEGLNVLGVVTADRIVGQIGTEHPLEGHLPSVTFLGTRFENLRIAGHPVKLDLNLDILGGKPKDNGPYTSDRGFMERVTAQHEGIRSQRDLPKEIAERYNQLPKASAEQGWVECSLVNQAEGGYPGRSFGHVIDVPNFGKIYLATLRVERANCPPELKTPEDTIISLTMIEMQMGCIADGMLAGGSMKTNGATRP